MRFKWCLGFQVINNKSYHNNISIHILVTTSFDLCHPLMQILETYSPSHLFGLHPPSLSLTILLYILNLKERVLKWTFVAEGQFWTPRKTFEKQAILAKDSHLVFSVKLPHSLPVSDYPVRKPSKYNPAERSRFHWLKVEQRDWRAWEWMPIGWEKCLSCHIALQAGLQSEGERGEKKYK